MASTTSSSGPPRRDALDDTVPAKGESGKSPPAETAPEEPPVRPTIPIDRYRIGKELGRGGMGRVVEAFDVQLGRTVALKEVLPKAGGGTHRRFAREIHITARLEHPSIVPLYDSGITSDGKPFYVMRRVSGQPLDELIAGKRTLDDRLTLLPSVLAAIDAVAHAHSRGVIHRDLKPANILVGEHGETIVIDWGLAKVVGEEEEATRSPPDAVDDPSPGDSLKTQIGSVFGTPGFMSPEQARGEVLDLAGDVYALGAVLYQLLAGAPPVAGVSATEVMDKTRMHDIKPLAETAPGAPRELVAIVDKAHAFDPANRYPDAGALAEDVRRFLAGQLVAAHDYSSFQRLARFARRHRGVLSVIAIATVAGAVMAWIGVARIVSERDAANEARREADAGKREAEETRDRLSERHDQLVISQARGLLEANPTEALAYLKQLAPTSAKLDEARALAQAATMRGVAWAVQTSNTYNFWASQDGEGRLLATCSRDGTVRVFELDRRRLLVARTFATDTRADWVLGGKLLLTHHTQQPALFDPKSNTIEPLQVAPISYVRVTDAGDRAIATTVAKPHAAGIYDAQTRTLSMLPFDGEVDQVDIAADGSWSAVSADKLLVIYDRDGKELKRHAGPVLRFQISRTGKLAVQTELKKILETTVKPDAPWTEVPIDLTGNHGVMDFGYRGDQLLMFWTTRDVMGWNGKATFRITTADRWTAGMVEGGDDTMFVPTLEGKVLWFNELGRGALVLPEPLSHLRLAARPGSSKVAAIGDGLVFVFDLALAQPRRYAVDRGSMAQFLDDDTLIVLRSNLEPRWQFLDLATGKTTDIRGEALMPEMWEIDPVGGRVLVRDVGPQQRRFWLLRRGQPNGEIVVEGPRAWASLVDGDAVVYGTGDSKVYARVGTAAPKLVTTVDGVAQRAAGVGQLVFAVRSNTGEVVRGELATGKLERVRVPTGLNGFLGSDARGRVLLAEDNRLLVWDGQVTEVARFDKPISHLARAVDGAIVFAGQEREVYAVKLDPPGTPKRIIPRSPNGWANAHDGRLVGAIGNGTTVQLVELPSLARWTLPPLTFASNGLGIAPKSRKVLQLTGTSFAVWQLPHVASDFRSWLDAQTNATIDRDSVLAWPWQQPSTTAAP